MGNMYELCLVTYMSEMFLLESPSPLSKRAWAFQERYAGDPRPRNNIATKTSRKGPTGHLLGFGLQGTVQPYYLALYTSHDVTINLLEVVVTNLLSRFLT